MKTSGIAAATILSATAAFAPISFGQDNTGPHEEQAQTQNQESNHTFLTRIGDSYVLVDYTRLGPETGRLTVNYISNLSPQINDCVTIGDVLKDIDPQSTKPEDIRKVVTHLQTHGYQREDIAFSSIYGQVLWNRAFNPDGLAKLYEQQPELRAEHSALDQKFSAIYEEFLESRGHTPTEHDHSEHDHSGHHHDH